MRGSGREIVRLLAGRLPSADEQAAIQLRRLRVVLAAAAEIPYYRRLFAEAGMAPADVRSLEDLRRVPVSTRQDLVAAGADALAPRFDARRAVVARTSGSTGHPWTIYRTRDEEWLRRALELRSMRRAGLRPRDTIATLGPRRARQNGPLGRLGLFRLVEVSPLLPVDEQVRRLRAIGPDVLWAYPTSLRALLREHGSLAEVVSPRLVVTAAEPLDDVLRRQLAAGGGPAIRNFYGSVECGRIAWECAAGEGLHVNADGLILELDGVEVPGAGHSLVVTNLNMAAMPLVRYRLGDLVRPVGRPCSCGAPLPLIHPPVGREWDAVELPSGRLLSPWGFNVHLRDVPGLRQYRVVQPEVDRLVFRLRFAAPPAPEVLADLRARVAEHVGEPLRIEIEPVAELPDSGQKFRTFVSHVGGRG